MENQPNHIIQQSNGINENLKVSNEFRELSMADFKSIVKARFEKVVDFGRAIGVSGSRASQLLMGYKIPVKPDMIKKIAEVLMIDVVKLSQLFSKLNFEGDGNESTNANDEATEQENQ